jgi:transcription elongation factor Elf1
MDKDFDAQKEVIKQRLEERITTFECPICHDSKHEFALGGGYFANDLQQNLTRRQMGGTSIPTIPVICKHCGFVAEFAVGALGLLPTKEENPEKSNGATEETK